MTQRVWVTYPGSHSQLVAKPIMTRALGCQVQASALNISPPRAQLTFPAAHILKLPCPLLASPPRGDGPPIWDARGVCSLLLPYRQGQGTYSPPKALWSPLKKARWRVSSKPTPQPPLLSTRIYLKTPPASKIPLQDRQEQIWKPKKLQPLNHMLGQIIKESSPNLSTVVLGLAAQ